MGLDQYIYASREPLSLEKTVDVDRDTDYEKFWGEYSVGHPDGEGNWVPGEYEKWKQIQYFRKHHDLQGWMSIIAEKRGGEMQWDSMVGNLKLTEEDMDKLEKDVEGDDLPETEGFFFGSGNTSAYKVETLEMIEKVREALKDGKTVLYKCSW